MPFGKISAPSEKFLPPCNEIASTLVLSNEVSETTIGLHSKLTQFKETTLQALKIKYYSVLLLAPFV
jgi:hypothetical protein